MTMKSFAPKQFDWRLERGIATIRLTRPERKNPLTFDSYAELRDTFRALAEAEDVGAVVFASSGGNFCSGGDVHEIIGPLLDRDMKGLLSFTRCRIPAVTAERLDAGVSAAMRSAAFWTAGLPSTASAC